MLQYLVSGPQFLKVLQSHKGEMGVLLFITTPFHHSWVYDNHGGFGEASKDADLLPREPTNRRLALWVLTPVYQGDRGATV